MQLLDSSTPSAVISGQQETYQVLGVLQQFLIRPSEDTAQTALIKGRLPSGCVIPLHSHPDIEMFFVLSGSLSVYAEGMNADSWQPASPGDAILIPSNAKHALRNASHIPVELVSFTGQNLFSFFQKLARPLASLSSIAAPTLEEAEAVFAAAFDCGIWLASPEENESIGLRMPNQ